MSSEVASGEVSIETEYAEVTRVAAPEKGSVPKYKSGRIDEKHQRKPFAEKRQRKVGLTSLNVGKVEIVDVGDVLVVLEISYKIGIGQSSSRVYRHSRCSRIGLERGRKERKRDFEHTEVGSKVSLVGSVLDGDVSRYKGVDGPGRDDSPRDTSTAYVGQLQSQRPLKEGRLSKRRRTCRERSHIHRR
jgi:hypothetical protein